MKQSLVIVGTGLLCFIAGYFVKQATSPSQFPSTAIAESQRNPGSNTSRSSALASSDRLATLSSRFQGIDPEIANQSIASMESAIVEDIFFRMADANMDKAADFLSNNPDLENWSTVAIELSDIWAKKDPENCYQWLLENRDRFEKQDYAAALGHTLSHYAKEDPTKIAGLFETLEDPNVRFDVGVSISQAWGATDPGGALKWLTEGGGSEMADDAFDRSYAAIMRGFISKDPVEATYFINQVDSTSMKKSLLKAAGQQIAAKNLTEAASWVIDLPDQDSKQAGLLGIVQKQSRERPKETLDLLISLPESFPSDPGFVYDSFGPLLERNSQLVKDRFTELPSAVQATVAAGIISSWDHEGSKGEEIVSFVETLAPGDTFDQGASALADARAYDRPQEATRWIGRIGDPKTRTEAIRGLISNADGDTLPVIQANLSQTNIPRGEEASISALMDSKLTETFPTFIIPEDGQ